MTKRKRTKIKSINPAPAATPLGDTAHTRRPCLILAAPAGFGIASFGARKNQGDEICAPFRPLRAMAGSKENPTQKVYPRLQNSGRVPWPLPIARARPGIGPGGKTDYLAGGRPNAKVRRDPRTSQAQ